MSGGAFLSCGMCTQGSVSSRFTVFVSGQEHLVRSLPMGLEGCYQQDPLSLDLAGLLKPVNDSIRHERLIVAGPINVR